MSDPFSALHSSQTYSLNREAGLHYDVVRPFSLRWIPNMFDINQDMKHVPHDDDDDDDVAQKSH